MVLFVPRDIRALMTCGPAEISVPTAATFGIQSAVESGVCSQIGTDFKTSSLGTVMGYAAKANAASQKGLLADYFSNPHVFSLGLALSVAVNNISPIPTTSAELESIGKSMSASGVPNFGVTAASSATLGISFKHLPFRKRGFFDPKNFVVYVGGAYLPPTKIDTYTAQTLSLSLYIQYKLFQGRKIPFGLVTWGGLDVGLGYSYSDSTYKVVSASSLTTINLTVEGRPVSYAPSGEIAIAYGSSLIPVEISTNVSLLYFLSLAIGAAADIHPQAQAKISATISGPVRVDGQGTADDYARFTLAETGKASMIGYRVFFGPQFNIWKVRIFALAHITQDTSYAVTLGGRFSW